MIPAFRVLKTSRLTTAFDGEGAKLAGGRWNSKGVAAVYTAGTLSLATLEILVHAEWAALFAQAYSFIKVEIPPSLIETYPLEKLPKGWNAGTPAKASMQVGDRWVRELRSLALRLPSAVIPTETNFLINPAHPDFPKMRIHRPERFQPDPRLNRPRART